LEVVSKKRKSIDKKNLKKKNLKMMLLYF
jgi:hypothetical protein